MKLKLLILVILLIIFLPYRNVFTLNPLVNTDLPYLYESSISLFPTTWDMQRSAGIGGVFSPFLWYYLPVLLPIKLLLNIFHFPWEIVQRVVLFTPFFLIGGSSTFLLAQKITKNIPVSLLAPLLFFINSYVLLLVSGGQLQIAIGISLLVTVLLAFFLIVQPDSVLQKKLGLLLFPISILFLGWYELRVLILSGGIIFISFVTELILSVKKKEAVITFLGLVCITGVLWLLGNIFWIVPVLLHRTNPVTDLGSAFYSSAALTFFSFATIEYPFSLHHPFWPENIFGKMNFFSPLFLLLPLSVVVCLSLSNGIKQYKRIVVLGLLFIVFGTFLAKGVNEPFGGVYEFLFFNVPGFSLFRDSSKFFIVVLVGYILLLPLVFHMMMQKFSKIRYLILTIGVLVVCIPVYVSSFSLTGTLKHQEVPSFYKEVTSYLASKNEFGRVLWYPTTSIYSYYSYTHPAVPAYEYFNEYSLLKLNKQMISTDTEEKVKNIGIRYIVVPQDSQQSIFIEDRKYSNTLYQQTLLMLDSLEWIKRKEIGEKLYIYEVPNAKPHIWSDEGKVLSFVQYHPGEYRGEVDTKKKAQFTFVETYNSFWRVTVDGKETPTWKTKDNTVQFEVTAGIHKITLEYTHQKTANQLLIGLLLGFVIYSMYSLIIWKKIR